MIGGGRILGEVSVALFRVSDQVSRVLGLSFSLAFDVLCALELVSSLYL